MTKEMSSVRSSHFADNWLAWITLRHFLSTKLIRELSSTIVQNLSKGALSLEELFHERMSVGDDYLEVWLLQPRETHSPLADYLQRFIRAIAWQNDVETFADLNNPVATDDIPIASVELAFRLSLVDLRWPAEEIRRAFVSDQSTATILSQCIQLARAASDSTDLITALSGLTKTVEWPLKVTIFKHLGDLFADNDAWDQALVLYEQVRNAVPAEMDPAWHDFLRDLTVLTEQSRASALAIVASAGEASKLLDNAIGAASGEGASLIDANASHDALVTFYAARDGISFRPDRRATTMLPPLLSKTHPSSDATSAWLNWNIQDAHREFGAVLRRQIALGLAAERRVTKALYSRFLFDELNASLGRSRNHAYFQMAIFFLLESEDHEAPAKVRWMGQLVDAYVDSASIQRVENHAQKHAGTKQRRQRVALELFSHWLELLAPDRQEPISAILGVLCRFAHEASISIMVAENIGGRSLEILKQVAQRRPELRKSISSAIAAIVIARLKMPGIWKAHSGALELAQAYEDVFSSDELQAVVDTSLELLTGVDPKSSMWPIVVPAMSLLVSEPVKALAKARPTLGRQVVEAILRFGTEQDGQQVALLYNLHNFDPALLRDPLLVEKLQEVVVRVRQEMLASNSTATAGCIQALLLVPNIAGRDGVHDAIRALLRVMDNAKLDRPSLSLLSSYSALMLLASRQQQISEAIGESIESFRLALQPVLDGVIALWSLARERPLIFAPFSLPPTTVPHPAGVHNWTYSSLLFATSMGRLEELLVALEAAKGQPALTDAINRAQTVRSLGSKDPIDVRRVRNENRDTFYAALGMRLAAMHEAKPETAREICKALLDQCFRQGPRDLDAAVLLAALGLELDNYVKTSDTRDYLRRAANEESCRLAIMPIFELMGSEDSVAQS